MLWGLHTWCLQELSPILAVFCSNYQTVIMLLMRLLCKYRPGLFTRCYGTVPQVSATDYVIRKVKTHDHENYLLLMLTPKQKRLFIYSLGLTHSIGLKKFVWLCAIVFVLWFLGRTGWLFWCKGCCFPPLSGKYKNISVLTKWET